MLPILGGLWQVRSLLQSDPALQMAQRQNLLFDQQISQRLAARLDRLMDGHRLPVDTIL